MADATTPTDPAVSTGPTPSLGGGAPAHPITPQVQSAIDAIFAAKPDQKQVLDQQYGGDVQAWLDSFVNWWDANGSQVQDRISTEFQPEMGLLTALGYQPSGGPAQPLEQTLLQGALPGLLANASADAGRQDLANSLQQNAISDYNTTRGLLGQSLDGGQFDAAAYLQKYPDVQSAWASSPDGPEAGTKMINGQPMTADQYAEYHYQTYGKAAGREATFSTSTRLQAENQMADQTTGALSASAKAAASAQLQALQSSIGQMQGNLQGELAARAAALQQQIAALNQNLGQYDATQRQALAQQISEQQANLEKAVAAQQQNLTTELAALNAAAGTQAGAQQAALQQQIDALGTAADAQSTARRQALQQQISDLNSVARTQASEKRASLQNEISSLGAATDAQSVARKAALQQQLTTLDQAAGTQAQAKRTALQTEIAGLTAAQAPMSAARVASAEALTTAVNLGLETTKDQLSAEQARNGYLGGSTMSDAALARAVVGARQQGAQALAGANEANASDVRTIQSRAATEGRGIDSALADLNATNATYGAGENRSLADELANNRLALAGRDATGQRTISDSLTDANAATGTMAAGEGRSLADELANNRFNVATLAATGTRSIADQLSAAQAGISAGGATGSRTLADALATGTQALGDTNATGTAAITNSTGLGKMNIGNTGATSTYNDSIYGAGANRSLADALSQGTYGISSNLATQLQGAADRGTNAKQSYFDNDYTRSLALASQLPSLTSGLATTSNQLAGLGTAGLNNTLNTLGWWSNSAQPQQLQTYTQQPSQSGNALGNLGVGLTGAALQIGNAQNWWQPKPATVTASQSASNPSYSLLGGSNPFAISNAQPFAMPTT
jgi:hypothetical protein